MTLVEADSDYVACPYSNEVIAGLRDLSAQRFGDAGAAASGVTARTQAYGDRGGRDRAHRVTLADGDVAAEYDRLVLAPGVDMAFGALPGYERGRRRDHAACVEGGRADGAAAAPAGGDGGWRRWW